MKKENKLIAEFMGMEESNGEYYRRIYNSGDWIPLNDLEYYTSWAWLMTVVEKIEDMGCEIVITNGECTISAPNGYHKETMGKKRFGATYNAVIEFINEYNKNK